MRDGGRASSTGRRDSSLGHTAANTPQRQRRATQRDVARHTMHTNPPRGTRPTHSTPAPWLTECDREDGWAVLWCDCALCCVLTAAATMWRLWLTRLCHRPRSPRPPVRLPCMPRDTAREGTRSKQLHRRALWRHSHRRSRNSRSALIPCLLLLLRPPRPLLRSRPLLP